MQSPSIADLLLPSKKQLIVYVVLLVTILLVNTQFAQQQLAQWRVINQTTLPLIRDFYQETSTVINQDMTLSKISIGLIWGAIGAVVYILFWLATNILREMRNIVVEELYFVKPQTDSLWRGRMLLAVQVLYRMGLIILIACFFMVVATVVFPFVMQETRIALENLTHPVSVIVGLASLLVFVVAVHGVVILARLLTVRDTLSRHVVTK